MHNDAVAAPITTVLFDADGVMQRTAPGWQDELAHMVGPRDDLNPADFAVAVQRAEAPTMDGRTDIVDAMVEVLRQHRVTL
ncbi:MAG TPA: hypothetical protein VEQ66_11535, partial [Propionibacteriaceae bacterium]|nr:hypothetical protein [Propionibacteriaceae bacterium]